MIKIISVIGIWIVPVCTGVGAILGDYKDGLSIGLLAGLIILLVLLSYTILEDR